MDFKIVKQYFKERSAGIHIDHDDQLWDLYVSYDKGPSQMTTYSHKPRGYYLHIQPFSMNNGMRVVQGWTGVYTELYKTGRFSAGKLLKLSQEYLVFTHPLVQSILKMSKDKLKEENKE